MGMIVNNKMAIYKNYGMQNILEVGREIDEIDEIIKSFGLSLQIPKGSFMLDRSIGSDFIKRIRKMKGNRLDKDLKNAVEEEALNFQLINIKNVEYLKKKEKKSLEIKIDLEAGKNIYEMKLEVNI